MHFIWIEQDNTKDGYQLQKLKTSHSLYSNLFEINTNKEANKYVRAVFRFGIILQYFPCIEDEGQQRFSEQHTCTQEKHDLSTIIRLNNSHTNPKKPKLFFLLWASLECENQAKLQKYNKLCDLCLVRVSICGSDRALSFIQAFYHLSNRLRILFGTVQYCKYFLRKTQCRNETCVFLHVKDKNNQIIVNDQIDQDVYDDHYDMALKIAEEDNFSRIRKILTDNSIDSSNIIKKGLKRAFEDLNLNQESVLAVPSPPKLGLPILKQIQQKLLVESRQQGVQREEQLNKGYKSNSNFSPQDYIKIRLIKKLIRENNSKMYVDEGSNQQYIHNRSKMILYRIVRY